MKKNILIDLDRLKNINTGLGQVALFFGEHLSKLNNQDIKFTFLVPKKYDGFFGNTIDYEIVSLKRRYFPFLCKKYDLWYSLHQDSAFLPARKNTPLILTIHDLNFLSEKTPAKAKKRLKKLQKKIDRATVITVISEFTKQEVKKHLRTGDKLIQVIYNGVEIKQFKGVIKPKYIPTGDILLSIGVVKEKKNLKVLIPFIEKLPKNYKLIIAGNDNFIYATEIKKEIKLKNLETRIIVSGQISDEDKFWLLKNCKAVLFPSKHEGMGIPPIEAMRFGKPVFASGLSSIPEICKDKAYYWDNFDAQYMSEVFLTEIQNFELSKTKSQELQEYSKKFNWQQNINEYMNLFEKILQLKN